MAYSAVLNGTEFFNTSSMRDDLKLSYANIRYSAGAAGEFNFNVPSDNICIEEFDPDESHFFMDFVDVYKNDERIFSGRVSKCTRNFDLSIDVTCEGLLAVLNDMLSAPVILGYDSEAEEGERLTNMQEIMQYFVDEYNSLIDQKSMVNRLATNSTAEDGIDHSFQFTFPNTHTCVIMPVTQTLEFSYKNIFYSDDEKMPGEGTNHSIEPGKTYNFTLYDGGKFVRLALMFQTSGHQTFKTVYVTRSSKRVTIPAETKTMTIRLEVAYGEISHVFRTVTYTCTGPLENAALTLGSVSNVDVEMNDKFTSYDTILSRLAAVIGEIGDGYLSMTKDSNDNLQLNYTSYADLKTLNQNVELGSNLLDLTYSQEAETIITCLLPFGEYDGDKKTIRPSDDSTSEFLSSHGMTWGRLSDRSIYVGIVSEINKYGKIFGTRTFVKKSHATSSLRLAKASYNYLRNVSRPNKMVDVSVVDLADAGYSVDEFEVASKFIVRSRQHISSDMYILCTEKELDLLDPSSSSLSFELYKKSLPKYVAPSGSGSSYVSDEGSEGTTGGSVTAEERSYWNNKSRVYRNASGALVISK